MYVLNSLEKASFTGHKEGGFVQEEIKPRSEVEVRGHVGRAPSPRARLGLYECKKSLFNAGAQKSTVRSTSTSSAYCVKGRGTVKAKRVLIWRVFVIDGPKEGQQMYTTCN